MKAVRYTTSEFGEFVQYEMSQALKMGGAFTAVPIKESLNENFFGIGVAITGSSCYNLFKMPKPDRLRLLEHLYSKNGLGMSVGRITIGSSDYSAELYTYDDTENDTELKDFSIKRDMEYIVPIIKEIVEINPDITLFASPWSPPGWMKTGGSVCGGYMRKEFVPCYAKYIVRFLKAYEECGIKITAVTPQNEPETKQSGKMPACIWHPDIEAYFIETLRSELENCGMKTQIWMYDHCFDGCNRVEWTLKNHPGCAESCNGVAFHYYDGAIEQTAHLRKAYPNLTLHMTEGGPRLYDCYATDWCKWGIMLAKALSLGYSSLTGWNLMLDETGGPNIGPFFCGGFVTRNSHDASLSYSGQYKAFRHFSPYITPDTKIYALAINDDFDNMSAYPNFEKRIEGCYLENDKLTDALILVNPNKSKKQVQFLYDGKWWYCELLPNSLSTVCFEK